MASARYANTKKSLLLVTLMILMTQVGYLENLNPWTNGEETSDQTSNMPDERAASLSSSSSSVNIHHGHQLSAKGLHTCSILGNGSLMCWGLNNRGQIGIGNTLNAHSPEWVDLGSGTNVTEVVNGFRHTCAILENGSLMCWGENLDGQMGNGQQYQTQTTPLWVDLGAGRTAASIDADSQNTCAIADNGSLYCWGDNTNGMLNDDPLQLGRQTTPRWIDLGGHAASEVSVGSMNVCSILNNGSLYCWGDDSYGQLARGSVTLTDSWVPLHVDFGAGVTVAQIDLGSQHVCAIVDNGSLYCWGRNSNGALGNGSAGFSQSTGTPSWVDLGTGRTAVAVSAGAFHTCAIVDNGSLYCWGMNSGGQAGIGSTVGSITTPQWVNLGVGRTAIAVSAGSQHTCAILDNGELKCWGQDYNGALGNGVGTSSYTIPQTVPGGFTWNTSTGSNSGGSSSNYALTPSVEGADLSIDVPMTNITFQYNASAASGSGSGSGSGSNSGTYNGNGTAWMVKNIRSGSSSSSPTYLTAVGNTLYFSANDGTNGAELWKSDGTASGTVMVKDIRSGSGSNGPSYLTAVGNTLYFEANDGTNGSELWKSDGTASGTVMVKDINSGSGGSTPSQFTAVGNTLYFSANDGINGAELWKSDGTESGTVMVKNIRSGSSSSSPTYLTAVGNTLYFQASDGTNGYELWKSDGTASGTVMVKDIYSGSSSSSPTSITAVGNTLYFQATGTSIGRELFKSDGTASGTVLVKDIKSGSTSGLPGGFVFVGNTLYFSAYDGTHGHELWKTDGTASGTVMVKDIRGGSVGSGLLGITAVGNTLYFRADDGTNGRELWKSDGTASGTVMVKDINSGSGRSSPLYLTAVGNTLYFRADDGINGAELWKSDGTESGTVMVKNIRYGSSSSSLNHLTAVGNTLYFSASDGTNGSELWALDPANITGLSGGSGSSGGMTNVTGATCTVSPALPTGLSIDSSTCTISGTPSVETSNTTYTVTANISNVTYQATVWLSSSYLELTPSVEGADLFIDEAMTNITFHYNASTATTTAIGTVDGQITTYGNGSTWKVADLHSGSGANGPGSTPMNKISYLIGDVHYFNAQSTTNGWELWAHNPSNGTLWEVTDISTASWGSYAGQYLDILVGDTLYFSANDDSSSEQLWAHDTSNDSTWKVIAAESNSGATIRSSADAFIAIDGDVFYFSGSLGNGYELIAYNTSNGTLWEAADMRGSTSSNPEGITASSHATIGSPILSDDVFVFTTTSDYSNKELWAYNISNATAWEAYDINPGIWNGGNPQYIAHIDDVVYFVGNCDDYCNPDIGKELFAYNATNQSGWLVADIVPGSGSGNPGDLMPDGNAPMVIDGTFYFDADDVTYGWELWAHTPANQTTWLAADINSGYGDSKPGWYSDGLGVIDGRLYFDADDGINGRELWVYDPSNASSWRLTDIAPGSGSGVVCCAQAYIGDTFYVAGDDGINGKELWAYDSSNGSSWLVENINTWSTADSNPGDLILIGNTIYFRANDGSTGSEMYAYQPAEIASSGSSGTCSISPGLPTGLNIDSSTCTISGTPTVETSNTTYTVTAVISNVTYQGSVWLSTSPYGTITSAVEGAHLNLGEAMTPITLNYTVNANASTGSTSSTSTFAYTNDKVDTDLHYTCAIQGNGDLKCWGFDDREQLGDGVGQTNLNSPPATAIDLGSGRTAKAVSTGRLHACALLDNGDVKCWGGSAHQGALGTGLQYTNHDTEASPPSTAINLGSGRTAVAVTAGEWHSCAILDNGEVKCWGSAGFGVLGTGSATQMHTTPSPAIDLGTGRTAVAISAGQHHTCAVLDNGELKCWGSDVKGQLGDGGMSYSHTSSTIQSSPTTVNLGTGRTAIAVSGGNRHTCAILDNGEVKCWGHNNEGQLGVGSFSCVQAKCPITFPQTYPTIDLGTGRTAVAVTAGFEHTCAILDNGDAKCWGSDRYGQLGNGAYGNSPGTGSSLYTSLYAPPATPIDLGTGRTAVAISAGELHTCAILDNGEMNCWGFNKRGQLGDGNSSVWPHVEVSPVLVAGSNTWDTSTTLVTWETHPALPAGMSISAGVISGTPSVYAKNQTYTIYANQSGYSTTHELYFSVDTDNAHTVVENQTIDPIGFHPPFNNGTTCWSVSPALPGNLSIDSSTGEITGSVNGTLTNTTYTVTANHGCTGSGTGGGSGSGTTTYGNGSTWNALDLYGSQNGRVGNFMFLAVGDTIYFDGFDGVSSGTRSTMWAYDTSNDSAWQIAGINSSGFGPGYNGMSMVVGDTIYFSNTESGTTGNELWAHDTSNGSSWRVADINSGSDSSNPGQQMAVLVGDTIYFSATCGNTCGNELWAHDTSNHSTWLAADIATGSGWGNPGSNMYHLIGDTLYFNAFTSSHGRELWAHDTSNHSTWQVADIFAGSAESYPGIGMSVVDGDILYFDARDANGFSIYAHNTTNGSTWPVHTLSTTSSNPLTNSVIKKTVGDAYYTSYNDPSTGIELWAFGFTNQSMWQVADIRSGSLGSSPGTLNSIVVGDTLYFDAYTNSYGRELWAHNNANGTTWQAAELNQISSGSVGSNPGSHLMVSLGDVIYFDASGTNADGGSYGNELWAHDTSNHSSWLVSGNTFSGLYSGPRGPGILIDDTLYFPGISDNSSSTDQREVYAHQPSEISPQSGGTGSGGSGSGGSTGTGVTETFTFSLQSLADFDGDGLANDLPSDYDAAEGPTPGLVADTDDDADGLLDTVETNTGTYVDSSDTGTDPLNPDTDGDGICDGPNAVPGVCVAGPDTNSGATVVDTPIVLLNNSDVDEIAPFYPVTGATYGLSPDLPTSMQFDASNGSIWGTPDMVMANTTYTMWANLTDGTSTSWTFFLEVLEDLDGDGMPDVLPGDYDATNDPIRTPGLEEDLDDDGDGYNDTAETDTGLYLDGNNTGTDPRDPDTDDDGICDGPGTVPGVCTAGPDLTPFGPPATVVAVNNTMIPSVPPYYAGSGLTYEVMPDLPAGLTIDPSNGFLMGVPTETIGNTTFTVYANHSDGTSYSWDFTIEVLEDSDGDGSPDTLPADYDGDNDSIRAPPGLTEDLDDDNDGASDLDEIANGTLPLNPDTDGDGFCDGINAVAGVCFAGPDPYPNDPNMPLDTDGDGLPDDDSAWTGPPYADLDDDNDGYPDVSEDACGSDSLDANSIPDDMDGDTICDDADDDKDGDGIENVNETGELGVPPGSSATNPDTDGDGICDGPESPVTSNCTAGPDMFPLDPSAWEDTDGDGYPNDLYPPSTSVPPLEEDTDDDNDGWTDIDEANCGSDPVNASDMPVDLNGDGVCDVLDLDWDDDGIPNANETDTGVYVDASDTGTDPWNPDTDGDGFCDGPFAVFDETDTICIAGPDPFPHDPNMPMDTDGDGMPNELPEDYVGNLVEDTDDDNDGFSDVSELNCDSNPLDAASTPTNDLDGDGLCDAEDPDVDGDGLSNETEFAEGSLTSYMNADTDGDGVCDGPSAPALPAGICVAGPDAFPDDPAAWLDTDGDGDPDELVDGITTDLVLDTDDDNDGWSDEGELACGTNTKDDMSTPFDGDDDGICDVLDTQTLGYTINGVEAEMFEAYVNQSDFILMPNLTGMEPGLWTIEPALPAGLSFSGTARSGETGIITGIPTEASPMTNYTVTADNGRVNISFTFGLGVLNDFDGDRVPDEPSLTGLEEDLDDDNDGHSDIIELKCGTDPVNQTSIPDVDEQGNCIEGKYAEDDGDGGNGFLMCLMPFCLILLLALLLLALLFKDKVILMGPEPENTTSDPAFLSGEGTKADPFILKPVKALKAGSTVEAKETISIVNMSPEIRVNLLDLAESTNDKRFRMYEVDGTTEEPGFNLDADDEGRLRLRFVFDDSDDPTYPGGTYEGLLKLGKASVYLSWTVDVKEDKRKMNKIRKEQEAAEKAEKEAKEAEEKAKAEAEAKEAEEKAKAEAETKAAEEKAAKEAEKKAKAEEKAAAAALAKKEKEEAAAKKKEEAAAKKAKAAEEKAAKEAEEAEAKAKAEAEAKAAEEKAAKEAEKKAKAEEKAAAAALVKKEKEEAAAKKKEEAEAKAAAAKKAKEEDEAKKKAEAEAKAAKEAEEKAKAEAAAKKKAEKKPATTKEAKKQEELQRVKQRAKTIDFKVIGEAESSELKSEVKKGATTLEVANAKDFAESGSAEINDAKGSTIIAWTGKDGNTLTGVSGVTRVFAAKAVLMVKDDLQVIKGIGPFIEEKLNALGITTYRQLANMTAKLETQVNEAIEFFPGRVKRDQWVAQAKILLGEDVKLDEKALKQAEELERIAQKAEGIDFGILGVASASEADDLQKIKGIGPFIAEKLNALGIYKFSQLANMTSEIEEEVNVAIEFFPGRVKRDEWAKQAKEFDSN